MRGWLLDTNVLSELRKPKPDSRVVAFIAAQPGDELFVSEITFAEISYGIEQVKDPVRRADLHLWLDRTLRPLFAGRVLAITEHVIVRWKTLAAAGRKREHTFSQPDLFIAAIGALEELVVVSRDTGEFIEAGVAVLNPWTSTLHAHSKAHRIKPPVTSEAVAEAVLGGGRR